MKSEYSNRFIITMDSAGNEALITFFSVFPSHSKVNDDGTYDTETNIVSKVILAEHNLRDLHNAIGSILEQISSVAK